MYVDVCRGFATYAEGHLACSKTGDAFNLGTPVSEREPVTKTDNEWDTMSPFSKFMLVSTTHM